MFPFRRPPPTPSNERTVAPFPGPLARLRARVAVFHVRDHWWRLLDWFEGSRVARAVLYLAGVAVFVGAAAWFWAYPWWNRRNAIKVAREWLASGHYRYAAEAAQRAALAAPDNPEPWQIAAELARLGGQKDKALAYARRAAELAPTNPDVVIGWAAEALRADQDAEAEQALRKLPPEILDHSPDALRLGGEIARRQQRLTAAAGYFEAALRLDGPRAVDEVPLGLILLQSKIPPERQRGQALLVKWTSDRDWGATAMRTLLADALAQGDRVAMVQWAEALLAQPNHTKADLPTCLLALGRADEARFAAAVAALERDHAVNPTAALQLLDWLNQIGRGAEAVRWMGTLPPEAMRRPPLVVAGAEALRIKGDWPALAAWTHDGNWGPNAEFLRWAYGLQAARMIGDESRADELWRTLYSHAQVNGIHALFAGSTLYGWGRTTEAAALWWRAAEQEGPNAIEALGSLARHYQVRRDADGEYRVFRQLYLFKPKDPAIGNNFAFFAALTGHELRLAETVARANLARDPANLTYLATCAFTVVQQGRPEEALALLKPATTGSVHSPAIAFAYGIALAAAGQKTEARPILASLPPNSLTHAEVDLISRSLGN